MERGIRNRTISLYILAELWYAFISRCLMIYNILQKYRNYPQHQVLQYLVH